MWNRSLLRYASLLGFAMLAAAPADDFRFSGPYTHENLSIFLIHRARNASSKRFLTLQEAMDQKKVVVYETSNVNELLIENLSSEDIYVQSGDIVKGGRQDRVFPDDFMLTSNSGKIPIASFCVERGRWSKRGREGADQFSKADKAVAGKSLKVAVRDKKDQLEVWNQVAQSQQNLAAATMVGAGAGVAGGTGGAGRGGGVVAARAFTPPPTSSMQLALEDKKVVEATDAYIRSLSKIIDGKKDVVGYAFAINGRVNSADVYASNDLFRRMWPKLLNVSAVEALTERPKMKTSAPPDVSTVRSALADAETGPVSSKGVAGRLVVVKRESEKALLFETRDRDLANGWIHKSYIAK
jgi:hypothetical protein